MPGLTPYELESLFIDKFTEKYQLTERDIKRAFAQYDRDGNGLLDLNEITGAIQLYLNGVSRPEVVAFVQYYDSNGDGNISFEEFFSFLTKRNAVPKKQNSKASTPMVMPEQVEAPVDHRRRRGQERPQHREKEKKREKWNFDPDAAVPHHVGVVNAWDETAYGDSDRLSRMPREIQRPGSDRSRHRKQSEGIRETDNQWDSQSQFDPEDEHAVMIRARRFVENVRALDTKRSMAVRNQDSSYDKHGAPLNEILDRISRLHIIKSLSDYLYDDDEARTSGVKYKDFCR